MNKLSKFGLLLMMNLIAFSCSYEDASEFEKKECIGQINDPFGMATYEIFLYKDSSFYLPSQGTIVHWAQGYFSIDKDTLSFKITRGESHLSQTKYIITKDTMTQTTYNQERYILTSIHPPKNVIFLEWFNRN